MYYIQNGEVLYIPGTMTPTEILSVCEAGAKIVKTLLRNIFRGEHQPLFCRMPYSKKRRLRNAITKRYRNLHILQPCWVIRCK
ncbi:hypothetical protein S83_038569 [Arachis hypogaea]